MTCDSDRLQGSHTSTTSVFKMLATRARIVPRFTPLARPSIVARRFYADLPSTTPSSSPPPPPPPPTTSASTAPVAAPTTQPRPTASPDVIPVPQQQRPRKMQDGYSGGFYLSLLGGLLLAAPPITYFYWEHRKTHMREKKEAILKEIHARVGVA
ncbi:hypothetical protein D6C77_03043 [Aureobasidium pullulans]|nr:hypothetical protein D6D04_01744 [Aureobasidium pullulans]THZ25847.1 hypothetical protein D6C89_04144 [Aureobasidium pullulans]TIA62052.1 hypothetical protein D6C77_03043 [Aureobasidium pullulans]